MQDYINASDTSNIIRIVKPNVFKVFVKNFIYISAAAAGIILILVYLDRMVGLDTFVSVLEVFGITVDPDAILRVSIICFLFIAALSLLLNYLNITKLRYEFYSDKMRIYESAALIFSEHKDIPYKNVVKISYNYDGFLNKMFHSGNITIEMTGMKEGSVKMELIDQTEELVEQLMKIITAYNSLKQMQFAENHKIDSIMKRF